MKVIQILPKDFGRRIHQIADPSRDLATPHP